MFAPPYRNMVSVRRLAGLREVMERGRAQNGRFFGYVHGSGEPVAALGDLFASVVNQNVTAWRSSPSAHHHRAHGGALARRADRLSGSPERSRAEVLRRT